LGEGQDILRVVGPGDETLGWLNPTFLRAGRLPPQIDRADDLANITENNGLQTIVIGGNHYYWSPFGIKHASVFLWRSEGGQLEFGKATVSQEGNLSLAGSALREFPPGAVGAGAVRAQRRVGKEGLTRWIDFCDADSRVVFSTDESDFLGRPAPELSANVLQIEGFTIAWNSREGRWEYADIDGNAIAYWDTEQKRVEITATTLTGMHIGLFRPTSIAEATRLFEEAWARGEFKVPLPFDPRGREFTLSEYRLNDTEFVAVGIVVPEGTVFYCPLAPETGRFLTYSDFDRPYGWGINLVDDTRNFLSIDVSSGTKLIQGRIFTEGKIIAIFTSGDPETKLSGFGSKFPIHMSSYQNDGKVTIKVLAIREDGLIGFIAD
jgi:hypothetical protein